MLSSWIILVVIAGIAATLFNTFLRRALKESEDSTAYGWWFECIRLVTFGLLIPFAPFFDYSWQNLGLVLLPGIVEVATIYFYMKMHATNELSLSTIVMQLRSIYVAIFAYITLEERLSLPMWIGIILIVVGAIIVTRPRNFRIDRSLSIALVAGILTGSSSVTVKIALDLASIPIVIAAFSLPSVLIMPLIMKDAQIRIKKVSSRVLQDIIPASIANVISMFALTLALRLGTASQVSGIFQGISMLAVAVGVVFMGERENVVIKLIAGAITIVGILLLV